MKAYRNDPHLTWRLSQFSRRILPVVFQYMLDNPGLHFLVDLRGTFLEQRNVLFFGTEKSFKCEKNSSTHKYKSLNRTHRNRGNFIQVIRKDNWPIETQCFVDNFINRVNNFVNGSDNVSEKKILIYESFNLARIRISWDVKFTFMLPRRSNLRGRDYN